MSTTVMTKSENLLDDHERFAHYVKETKSAVTGTPVSACGKSGCPAEPERFPVC